MVVAKDLITLRSLDHSIVQRHDLGLDLAVGILEHLALLEAVLSIAVCVELRDLEVLVEYHHGTELHSNQQWRLLWCRSSPLSFMGTDQVSYENTFILVTAIFDNERVRVSESYGIIRVRLNA